jgi:hypothetical protein
MDVNSTLTGKESMLEVLSKSGLLLVENKTISGFLTSLPTWIFLACLATAILGSIIVTFLKIFSIKEV